MFKKWLSVSILLIIGGIVLTGCTDGNDTESEKDSDKTEVTLPAPDLEKGANGQKVKDLKQLLDELGYTLSDDGTFNGDTEEAIKDFQSQQEKLAATGIYDENTKKWLQRALNGDFSINPGEGFSSEEVTASGGKTITVSNPKDKLVLVNKEHALPDDYEQDDLVIPDVRFPYEEDIPKKYMREEAAEALEEMFDAGDKDGIDLFGQSGYRSYDRQQDVFDAYVAEDGKDAANKYSARPGESEHQSGLTMDVTSPDINFDITEEFADTDEGKWLKKNAHK